MNEYSLFAWLCINLLYNCMLETSNMITKLSTHTLRTYMLQNSKIAKLCNVQLLTSAAEPDNANKLDLKECLHYV